MKNRPPLQNYSKSSKVKFSEYIYTKHEKNYTITDLFNTILHDVQHFQQIMCLKHVNSKPSDAIRNHSFLSSSLIFETHQNIVNRHLFNINIENSFTNINQSLEGKLYKQNKLQ